MSWQDSKWAIGQQAGTASAKAVLLVIAEACKDGRCYLSHETIGVRAEVDRRTVIRQMKGLEERGLIRRQRRSNRAGHRTTDLIILQRAILAAYGQGDLHGGGVDQDDNLSLSHGDDVSLGHPDQGDKSDVAKVTSKTLLGDRVSQEPVLNRDFESESSLSLIGDAGCVTPMDKTSEPDGFSVWWANYPKRTGRKKAAEKFGIIIRDGEATAQEMIDGAVAYAASARDPNLRFTKNPITWLNQGCWTDEYQAAGTADASGLSYALDSLSRAERDERAALQVLSQPDAFDNRDDGWN